MRSATLAPHRDDTKRSTCQAPAVLCKAGAPHDDSLLCTVVWKVNQFWSRPGIQRHLGCDASWGAAE